MIIHGEEAALIFDRIIDAVGMVCGIDRDRLIGRARTQAVVEARFIAMGFCRDHRLARADIAQRFQRDPGSVDNALRRREDLLATSEDFRSRYNRSRDLMRQPISSKPSARELLREIVFSSGAGRDLALSRAAAFLAGRKSA